MSELKPCPFCGADNGYVDVIPNPFSNDIYSRGHCIKCHAVGTFYRQSWLEGELRPSFEQMAQMATEQWNTRPIEDELRKRIAELETERMWRIAELEAERRWRIIADGEMPDDRATVLVAFTEYPEQIDILTATYYKHYEGFGGVDNWWDIEGWHSGNVTHWMPLPQPPEVQQ